MTHTLLLTLKDSLRNPRRLCLGLLIGLGAAALLWWVAAGTPSVPLEHRFVAGERLVFRLEYLSTSASNMAGLMQAETVENANADADGNHSQVVFTNLDAELETTVLEANADGAASARKETVTAAASARTIIGFLRMGCRREEWT